MVMPLSTSLALRVWIRVKDIAMVMPLPVAFVLVFIQLYAAFFLAFA
jgi:hypothetical protein